MTTTPSQKLYTGVVPVVGEERKPRIFTGRSSAPAARTEQIQRLYKIPEFMRTAAETWVSEGGEDAGACSLRQAASVIFVRDGEDGLETILTYRPGSSPLGVVAFPGGTVTPGDDDATPWYGPTPDEWSAKFKFKNVTCARRTVIAAIRESFEETGLLLAGEDGQNVAESGAGEEQMSQREAIADQDKSFGQFLTSSGLKLRTDLLRPVSRWQSPDFFHKRYDIAYFTTVVPVGQNAKLLEGKGVWGSWVNVRTLMESRDTSELGDRIGQPNTVGKTLEELVTPAVMCMLESLATSETGVSWLAKRRTVEVKKPVLVKNDGACMLSFTEVVPVSSKTGTLGTVGSLKSASAAPS